MSEPPIAVLRTADAGFAAHWERLAQRRHRDRARLEAVVAEIVADVRARGDAALIAATERYDGYRLEPHELVMGPDAIAQGVALPPADDAALREAAERVRRYHALRVPQSWVHRESGETLGQIVRPLASVALYVPAGAAPLASTVLMLGMPAAVAGVREVAMASPGRRVHPAVLRAAQLAGVTRLHRIGGAQAVAALALGTESVARVDKIVGPGNAYVQEAKRQVFGDVAIDAEAGPSEVFIVADASAPAEWVAADLLAQAEHPEASVVLASPSAALVQAVRAALVPQLAALGAAALTARALAGPSALIVTRDLEEAFALANAYAAEHLQILVEDPERWLERIEHAGAIFVGPHSPVPLGDYVAGPSHVLPTGGTARFFSVVGVEDFQKRSSLIRMDAQAFARIGPAAQRLAELEGLEAHARAIAVRLEGRR